MLDGMFYWLTGLSNFEVVAALLGIVVLDVPRYLLTNLAMVFYDSGKLAFFRRRRYDPHLPSVCAIISCLNEEETISQTLRSVYGSYPGLEIVVIDDGSTDSTFALASGFAKTHPGVKVIRRPVRGGKGSACNFGLVYTKAEIVVMLDSDSEFGKHAIFHIVQPFREPKVGAVSGAIHVRNVYTGLPTWLQAWEYLATIQVGRILASKLGTLSIASGAFGAYRRSAVLRGYGFDASVAEDLDVTLRLRKSGYKIVFAPLAEYCSNNGSDGIWPT
jgi:cellulose synthase/poly-beta-1,6-N-acetylglucosamine synthase-like glycosyltransferase